MTWRAPGIRGHSLFSRIGVAQMAECLDALACPRVAWTRLSWVATLPRPGIGLYPR
jgi:hypothetical protein